MRMLCLIAALLLLTAACDEHGTAQPDLPSVAGDTGTSADGHAVPADVGLDALDASKDAPAPDAHGAPDSKADLLDMNMMVDANQTVDFKEAAVPDISTDAIMCNGVNCNDNIPCTDDACSDGGCINAVKAGFCLIGGVCHKDKTLNGTVACQLCDAKASATSWTDDVTLCTGSTQPCAQTTCTAGVCGTSVKSGHCLIGGACYSDGTLRNTNDCQACISKDSKTAWSNRSVASTCKADSHNCTADVCDGAGTCTHPVKAGHCLIGGGCFKEGALRNTNSCQACISKDSTTAWSNRSVASSCKPDSHNCTADVCDGAGTCTHPVKPGFCLIGGGCFASGQGACP